MHLIGRCLLAVGDGCIHDQQRQNEHKIGVIQQDNGQQGRHLQASAFQMRACGMGACQPVGLGSRPSTESDHKGGCASAAVSHIVYQPTKLVRCMRRAQDRAPAALREAAVASAAGGFVQNIFCVCMRTSMAHDSGFHM